MWSGACGPSANRSEQQANPVDWHYEPHLQLWQAATVLREHRGDGHVASLLAVELDPCEALVSFAALGTGPTEVFANCGWSEAQWAAAGQGLRQRGWLNDQGEATVRGRQGRRHLEQRTDELAAQPWQTLGNDAVERLVARLGPIVLAVLTAGICRSRAALASAHRHLDADRRRPPPRDEA